MFYEPASRDRSLLRHDPFKAIIAPRPIGWISTVSAAGMANLAPYSFFNAIAGSPPIIAFASESRKHTVANAEATGEFVWNMATFALRHAMNASAAILPEGESEFVAAGLDTAPCRHVRPPRVAASPAALECRVIEVMPIRDLDGNAADRWLVTGQVVGVHLDPDAVRDGQFDLARVQALARCGYQGDYAVVDRLIQLDRPE